MDYRKFSINERITFGSCGTARTSPPHTQFVRREEMMKLDEIHNLEVQEEYPRVIDELESLLRANPDDSEVVTRLGFNLWLVVVEAERIALQTSHDNTQRIQESG